MLKKLGVISPQITTYDKNDFYNNWEVVNKNLAERWDAVVINSPHKELKKPTLTDLYFVETITKHLTKWLPRNKKGKKLLKLDLYNEATMTATLADWFINKGFDYWGVDISKEVVKLARKNFKDKIDIKQFKVGDIRNLPFKKDHFDVVYSFGTIEHIRENQQSVNEAFRVLKPGGMFITGVNNKLDMWGSYLINEATNKIFKHITSYEASFYPKEQRSWLVNSGFIDIKTSGMVSFPHAVRYSDLFMEWKLSNGIAKKTWNNFVIRPFIKLAKALDGVEIQRFFRMHTTSYGYKPK